MLKRNSQDRVIGGVCSGLGKTFQIDTSIIRIAFLIAFFGFGTGAIPYLIIWLLTTEE